MTEWNDFYVAVAGASAALTGLIFVGVSISLTKILSLPGLPDRAFLSLSLLLNVLVQSLLFLVPKQSINTLGTEVLVIGCLAWFIILRLDIRVFQSKQQQYRRLYLFHISLNQAATIFYIIAGLALITNRTNAEYWLVPAILISITKAVLDGWILLVEIHR